MIADTTQAQSLCADIMHARWDGLLPVRPEEIARLLGVSVVWRGEGAEEFSCCAALERQDGRPVIAVSYRESVLVRRFAVAHALGHWALQHGPVPPESSAHFNSAFPDPLECAANAFAIELLVPRRVLSSLVSKARIRSVKHAAELFSVSPALMGVRLQEIFPAVA